MEEQAIHSRKEDIEEISKKRCHVCIKESVGIIRGVFLCVEHYSTIERDNAYRHKKDIEIEVNLNYCISVTSF